MKKLKLGVIVGGQSEEHEVSLVSGYGVISNLDSQKYEVYVIVISKEGIWFLFSGEISRLKDSGWHLDAENLRKVFLSPEGLHVLGSDEVINLDVVFPVLHGTKGEDGNMQGLLDIVGIPFVGSKTAASAVCMDKDFTSIILKACGIPVIDWITFLKFRDSYEDIKACVEERFDYPVFVKPANSGSSVGVSKVKGSEDLENAVSLAFRYDKKILIQKAIVGQEIECAVLGNHELIASITGEIEPFNEFYDYEAKYSAPSKLHIPARISQETSRRIQALAKRAYETLGCKGLCRVDFIVSNQGEVLLNELNTLPGFTPISMYPKLMEVSGVPYANLLDRLIDLALI